MSIDPIKNQYLLFYLKKVEVKTVFWSMRQTSQTAKGTQFHWYRLFYVMKVLLQGKTNVK